METWWFWAVLSAMFAASTAIFAKVGIANVNSDFATFVRSVVILGTLALILSATNRWENPASVTSRTWLFLTLSGLATGASWICYFRALKLGDAARVASIEKGGGGQSWLSPPKLLACSTACELTAQNPVRIGSCDMN